jgi:hypothetical protein
MHQISIQKTYSAAGKSFSEQRNVSGENMFSKETSLPAAKLGTLTTRTDNDTGLLTMAAGHGFVVGQKLDLFWEVAGVKGTRRNMNVTAVGGTGGNDVTVDGGAGDNLPAAATANIAVTGGDSVDISIDPDDMVAFVMYISGRGNVQFLDAGGVELKAYVFPDSMSDIWYKDSGITNPLGGNPIAKIRLTSADAVATREARTAILYN